MSEPEREADEVVDAASGDADALTRVWHRHRRWVAVVLLAHKPREAELEDLLQEVAITLVSKVQELRDESAIKPWLRTVALNVARASGRRVTRERRHRAAPEFARDGAEGGAVSVEPGSALHRRDDAMRVLGMAGDLPEGYREPLLLRCVHGMSYREIGAVMELPETTIETRIARGRRMLRERLEHDERTSADRPIPAEVKP